ALRHVAIGLEQVEQRQRAVGFPHLHRVALDQRIRLLSANAGLGQRQHHPLRMDEAAHAVEVLQHPAGVDHELVDQAGEAPEREVEGDRRVRPDEALDRRVGNFALSTGLRLCGMAELPFCPGEKYSSASSTSVRCRCRTSVASRSIDEAMTASVAKNIAWRSRGITCVETGSTARPSSAATWASTSGGTLAKVPTAPEMAQVATSARAARSRSRLRANSA